MSTIVLFEVGATFGSLVVLAVVKARQASHSYICECICGSQLKISHKSITGRKSCGCPLSKAIGISHPRWKGCGDISMSAFHSIVANAKKRDITVEVSLEQIWQLFLQQDGICPYTGRELTFKCDRKGTNRTASLDRIDSNRGYVLGNIQWVHILVNKAKVDLTEEVFLGWCKIVTEYNDGQRISL